MSPAPLSPESNVTKSPPYLVSEVLEVPYYPRLGDPWKDILSEISPNLRSLIGHYQNITSLTLANDDPAKLAWQSFVPELATNHPYLVHGVLSVASLHLSCLYDDPIRRSRMNIMAVDQMNWALACYRPAIGELNEENAASLFATATLTTVFVFRTATAEMEETLATLPKGNTPIPQDTINHLVLSINRTVWSLRGAIGVLTPRWQWVTDSKLKALCTRQWWPKHRIPANERALEEDRRLCRLESLWIQPGRNYQDHFQCLTDALQLLRDTYALVSQLTMPDTDHPCVTGVPYSTDNTTVGLLKDRAAIIAWVPRISREFINLLEQRNRDALVILAYWAILLGRIRDVWWLEGLGANLITAIAIIMGRDNWHLLEWPAEAAGIDLKESFG